ncbi:MAG: hypothetical protein Q8R00_00515 [Candidatus Nanoarchaeia archaeon]|nr:hypothetical protein [Candidatus Nanoarchaeia archaeon]
MDIFGLYYGRKKINAKLLIKNLYNCRQRYVEVSNSILNDIEIKRLDNVGCKFKELLSIAEKINIEFSILYCKIENLIDCGDYKNNPLSYRFKSEKDIAEFGCDLIESKKEISSVVVGLLESHKYLDLIEMSIIKESLKDIPVLKLNEFQRRVVSSLNRIVYNGKGENVSLQSKLQGKI